MATVGEELNIVLSYIFAITSIIICSILLGSLINNHHIKSVKNRTKPNVLRLTYVVIISYILFDILQMVYTAFVGEYQTWNAQITLLLMITVWLFAQLALYILLMLRLYHSFHGTKYAISKTVYCTFIILITLFIACAIISSIFYCIAQAEHDQTAKNTAYGAYEIGLEITDFIVSVFLIWIFVKKMIDVTVDLHSNQKDVLINDQIARLNDNQKLLLNITAKYFVLSFIATVWTQFTCLLFMLAWILYALDLTEAYYIVWDIMTVFWCLDGIINPICLYLIFEINDKWYKKGCNGCHSFARLCFRKCTQRKVKQRYPELEDELAINLLHE